MKFLSLFLVPLAVAGLLVGCGSSDNNDNTEGGVAFSLFTPVTEAQVPVPFDLFFADSASQTGLSADGTLNIPNDPAAPNPLVTAVNLLDGFSTTASIFTDFIGADIDLDIANSGGVLLISSKTGALIPGVDYEVVQSPVITTRPRLLIRPLTPLTPATTYFVVLTGALRTASGGQIVRARQFGIAANPNPVGSPENPADGFTPEQQETLELIRSRLIRPIFDGVLDPNPNIDSDNVLLAWSFTTQSIGASLKYLAANPTVNPNDDPNGGIRVRQLPVTTGQLGLGLRDTAAIYAGTFDLPYYLADAATSAGPLGPLTMPWASDGTQAAGNSALPDGQGGNLPCAFIAPSESTTQCYPQPKQRSVQSVPVLVTVPKDPDGGIIAPPANGYPVVIFQHGITADRTSMLAIAPTLAAAGFVTVAIDIPLHGVAPDSQFRLPGVQERTFDLDVMPADGTIDSSGASFINLANIAVSRDNLREAVTDDINLNATLRAGDIAAVDVNGDPGAIAINPDKIFFVGHSLGGIIGSTLLGVVPDDQLRAATLAMPGGGIIRLLDGSPAFGPVIAGGLQAAAGIAEGSDTYETFLRFAQTVTDTADPINHAVAASTNHAIHMIEVVGGANDGNNPPDLVVPNFVARNSDGSKCPASAQLVPFLDTVCVAGRLSGTNPLVNAMGLNMVTISPPYSAPSNGQPSTNTVIRFTAGHHSSILVPTPSGTPGVDAGEAFRTTCEMQSETAMFLAQAAAGVPADNVVIPIGATDCTPPAPVAQ